jgi:hypothetical protein
MENEDKEKCYAFNGVRVKDNITCAGLPSRCYQYVTWDNFNEGTVYNGKLQPKRTKGGIVLTETTFEIKSKEKKVTA